jgi:uncharacterized membrane protein YGL010W
MDDASPRGRGVGSGVDERRAALGSGSAPTVGEPAPVRRVDALFGRYGESHRHPTNQAIHWICVPLIAWSLLALLWAASPAATYALIGLSFVFYLTLSFALAMGMLAVAALMVAPLVLGGAALLPVAAGLFVVAWIGQLIGHRIEGRKPSFLEDVKFLLVGPAWLLHLVYQRLGVPY